MKDNWLHWDKEGRDTQDSWTVTSDLSRKRASWDVLVVVFDEDAVVSRQHRQVGHGAGAVLVVHTADVSL